jgi:hypothetical protein
MDRANQARSIAMSAPETSRWNETTQIHRTATKCSLPAETVASNNCEGAAEATRRDLRETSAALTDSAPEPGQRRWNHRKKSVELTPKTTRRPAFENCTQGGVLRTPGIKVTTSKEVVTFVVG